MESSWTWGWALRNIIAELLMPPTIWIVLGLFFLIFLRKRRKMQSIMIGLMFAFIWITSTTVFSQNFYQFADQWMHWPKPLDLVSLISEKTKKEGSKEMNEHQSTSQLENKANPTLKNQEKTEPTQTKDKSLNKNNLEPKAIVILGSGIRNGATELPQYEFQDVSKEAMVRLRMGARLAKITHLPILVTGGRPDRTSSKDKPEGQIMANVLENELGVKVQWVENQSNTTQENAKFSARILKENQIDTIYLITNDWHMPRSIRIFEKEGLNVIPAPTGFNFEEKWTPLDYIVSSRGIEKTRQIWHELLGHVWYQFRY
jgi:uncharacterized SAM-binding protein YcdF (DUF218 family)